MPALIAERAGGSQPHARQGHRLVRDILRPGEFWPRPNERLGDWWQSAARADERERDRVGIPEDDGQAGAVAAAPEAGDRSPALRRLVERANEATDTGGADVGTLGSDEVDAVGAVGAEQDRASARLAFLDRDGVGDRLGGGGYLRDRGRFVSQRIRSL